VVCTLPASQLPTLTQNPNVSYVSADRPLAARLDYAAAAVNVGRAWKANWTGTGIGVAVIDSGVSQSPDLAVLGLLSRVVYTKDFTGGNGSDQYGQARMLPHRWRERRQFSLFGLHSLAGGHGSNASIINLRVLDANGQGSDSSCWQRSTKQFGCRRFYNIRVINLSLGRPIYESYKLEPNLPGGGSGLEGGHCGRFGGW